MLKHLPLHTGFDERADSPPVLDPAIEPTLVGQFLASCEAAPASGHGRTASSGKPAASHRTASHRTGLRPATHRSGAHHATSDGRRGLLAARRHVAFSVLHTGPLGCRRRSNIRRTPRYSRQPSRKRSRSTASSRAAVATASARPTIRLYITAQYVPEDWFDARWRS